MSESRFTRRDSVFAMTCTVEVSIRASPKIIWALLTDASNVPRWNSTINRIEGQIREGERIRLHVPGTKRTFTPKVAGVIPERSMVWSDGVAPLFSGVRTFNLAPDGATTRFRMEERFSGVVFALTRRLLPDFGPIFETYASDLKREAEKA